MATPSWYQPSQQTVSTMMDPQWPPNTEKHNLQSSPNPSNQRQTKKPRNNTTRSPTSSQSNKSVKPPSLTPKQLFDNKPQQAASKHAHHEPENSTQKRKQVQLTLDGTTLSKKSILNKTSSGSNAPDQTTSPPTATPGPPTIAETKNPYKQAALKG